jgi:hypothetical protein
MNLWTLATDVAIWVLIAGSLGVFAWFLVEVVRLVRARLERERRARPPGEGPPPTG